jgi:hypothetical protein
VFNTAMGANMKHALRYALILVLMSTTAALLAQVRGGGMGVAGGAHLGGVAGGVHSSGLGHSGSGAGRGFGVRPVRPGIVGGFRHRGFGFRGNRFLSPFWANAFWWDDGYSDDGEQAVVQPPAPVVVQEAAPAPVQEVQPANPLLIELQGDRFVRLTGNEVNPPAGATATTEPGVVQANDQLPSAVLVFRDGRRQEVSSYSIIGPVLYASGSHWMNGYWTQKILLADLNLPATLEANQERGVNFVLPSAPNQVVTRP